MAVIGMVWAVLLAGCATPTVDVADRAADDQLTEGTPEPTAVEPDAGEDRESTSAERATPSPSPTSSPTDLARPAGVPATAQPAVVERIVDGDTFWVRVGAAGSGPLSADATHKIRLLEYDSPEATTSTECFGPEATDRLAGLTPVGTDVWLEADAEDTDRYGRFLRYVWLADGTMVNLVMVEEGFGEAVLYEPNDAHIELLRAAEQDARAASVGMWGPPCDYDALAPAPDPQPEDVQTSAPPADDAASNPWGTSSCDPAYEPCVPPKSEVGDLDCADIRSHYPDGVRVDHAHGDDHGLDGDEDGWGCE